MIKIHLTLASVEGRREEEEVTELIKAIATAFIQGRIYGLWLQQDKRYLRGEYDSEITNDRESQLPRGLTGSNSHVGPYILLRVF